MGRRNRWLRRACRHVLDHLSLETNQNRYVETYVWKRASPTGCRCSSFISCLGDRPHFDGNRQLTGDVDGVAVSGSAVTQPGGAVTQPVDSGSPQPTVSTVPMSATRSRPPNSGTFGWEHPYGSARGIPRFRPWAPVRKRTAPRSRRHHQQVSRYRGCRNAFRLGVKGSSQATDRSGCPSRNQPRQQQRPAGPHGEDTVSGSRRAGSQVLVQQSVQMRRHVWRVFGITTARPVARISDGRTT